MSGPRLGGWAGGNGCFWCGAYLHRNQRISSCGLVTVHDVACPGLPEMVAAMELSQSCRFGPNRGYRIFSKMRCF